MRFLLATAILAQSSLPAASAMAQPSVEDHVMTTSTELMQQRNIATQSIRFNEPEVRRRARRRLQNALQKKSTTMIQAKPSVLRNPRRRTTTDAVISTDQKECAPDIGILGCGVNQYCVESDSSTLGGLCLSQESFHDLHRRNLRSYFLPAPSVCDPTSFDAGNYDCNCDKFDLAEEIGEFTCTLSEYECKTDNLCGNNEVTHVVSEGGAVASYCYGFEKPYDIDLCYTVDTERNCNISVQNEACAKCEIVDGVVHPIYGFIGYNCYDFDCTNTLAGLRGNNCAGDYVLDALNGLTMPSSSPSTPLPSSLPSASPSQVPSLQPSFAPTVTASSQPTALPSVSPSMRPSSAPTDAPSQYPSAIPSTIPSTPPSAGPSMSPTITHSTTPTMLPSSEPSMQPSPVASFVPTRVVSGQPSLNPSESPSIATAHPSEAPSFEPWDPSKEDKANRSRGGEEMDSAGNLAHGDISLSFYICSTILLVALL
ncbi:unnamed protein product [Cylindrotheca closterium]|uniref:Circumsporozoite protein n=1 Tax=Cylindrotheca closterium TaxID=2856 RepID=A0AAD2CZ65_9STRA|nr:unnamed protein product [Cylindrotheca closterium]